jgi:hypothetical protein
MNRRTLNSREVVLLLLTCLAAVVGAFYWLLYSPLKMQIERAKEELVQQEAILTRYHRLLAQEEALLSQYHKLQSTSHGDNAPASQIDMVDRLQVLAADLVEFRSIRPLGTSTSSAVPQELVVECDCVTEFDDLLKFLYKIELEDPFLSLKNLVLSVSQSEPGMVNAHFLVDNGVVP